MNGIFNTDSSFDFQKLHLAKPYQIPGGNFFIRFSTDNKPLYIQPPKCTTKQGILKAGKKYYTDLMFTNEHADFIEWMENLESHCQNILYKNRSDWFEGDMEMHDIENYFTAPLKIYKSGKFYISRVNITTNLGKPTLKIYNEDEDIISIDDVNDKMNIMTILEIKGIRCSATCFQIDIDIKQMMTMKPENIFDKCLFNSTKPHKTINIDETFQNVNNEEPDVIHTSREIPYDNIHVDTNDKYEEEVNVEDVNSESSGETENNSSLVDNLDKVDTVFTELDNFDNNTNHHVEPAVENTVMDENVQQKQGIVEKGSYINKKPLEEVEMQEIELSLDKIPEDCKISIKNKNNIYYEMYKEAKRKAKVARDLALSSYLEAKRIKNVYMLEDASDSEDSDYENIEDKIE